MSDKSTTRLLEMYLEEATAPMFLSRMFQTPRRNFHSTEKVEIDVIRDDEDIAIVITDLSTGPRNNESNLYTNKGFTPPILWEKGSLNSFTQMRRQAGVDPFQDPNFGANAVEESFQMYRRLERKLRRTVEQMASQVLQTGKLTLTNENGVALYELDFGARPAHMAPVVVPWALDGTTGDPLGEIEARARLLRRNGKKRPFKLVFGSMAFRRFKANPDVVKQFDKDVFDLAKMEPTYYQAEDATFEGYIKVGQYRFEMWTYDGFYRDPVTGDHVEYVAPENVLMFCKNSRLDLSYGSIPRIVEPDPRVRAFLPPRISSSTALLDLTPNAWVSPDGTHVSVSVGTRPLTIPTAIDTFANMRVVP